MGYGVIGSTTDFDSVSRGSWPRIPASSLTIWRLFCTHRLMVRTSAFHAGNGSSILPGCTTFL